MKLQWSLQKFTKNRFRTIQNKTKPVKVYGKAKCLCNSGLLKWNLLMLCDKFSQKIKTNEKNVTSNH